MPPSRVKPSCATGKLGLDRNVGQATDSGGALYRKTDQVALQAKIRRKQRHLARKRRGSVRQTRLRRRGQHIRANDTPKSAGRWPTRPTRW